MDGGGWGRKEAEDRTGSQRNKGEVLSWGIKQHSIYSGAPASSAVIIIIPQKKEDERKLLLADDERKSWSTKLESWPEEEEEEVVVVGRIRSLKKRSRRTRSQVPFLSDNFVNEKLPRPSSYHYYNCSSSSSSFAWASSSEFIGSAWVASNNKIIIPPYAGTRLVYLRK